MKRSPTHADGFTTFAGRVDGCHAVALQMWVVLPLVGVTGPAFGVTGEMAPDVERSGGRVAVSANANHAVSGELRVVGGWVDATLPCAVDAEWSLLDLYVARTTFAVLASMDAITADAGVLSGFDGDVGLDIGS